MKDPATGRSRAERALGEAYPKKAPKKGVKTKKLLRRKQNRRRMIFVGIPTGCLMGHVHHMEDTMYLNKHKIFLTVH